MTRWRYSEGAASKGACAQCFKRSAKFVADEDGAKYCSSCWEAWRKPQHGFGVQASREIRKSGQKHVQTDERTKPIESAAQTAMAGNDIVPDDGFWSIPVPPSSPQCVASTSNCAASEEIGFAALGSGGATGSTCVPSTYRGAQARLAAEVSDLRRLGVRGGSSSSRETGTDAADQQSSEIEELQFIYGEDIQVISAEGEWPKVLRFNLNVPLECDASIFVSVDGQQALAGSVDTLPPLVTFCVLPPGYPSEEPLAPPRFVLEAEHLSSEQLEELSAGLREVCQQRVGEPVLFDCLSMLQERFQQPQRVELPDTHDAMDLALRLLAHARLEQDQRRRRELQECPVCLDKVIGSRGIFLSCGHFGCRDCLEQMSALHTSELDLGALRCPTIDCREFFDPEIVRELLAEHPEALKKWEDVSLRRCLESMKDVVFCPRCDLDGSGDRIPCIIEDTEDFVTRCGVCHFAFCGRCRAVCHPGTPCPTADDRLEALEARAAGTGPDAKLAQEELMTLRSLARTTKSCPGCGMAIEKSEGCSKVRCESCKVIFCWRCGKEIEGYDHFASSECRLFDDDEIRRWNQRVHQVDKAQARAHEARFLAQFIDPAKFHEQMRECPRCRAAVLREGKSNHLRCYACQTHFCARCNEVLPSKRPGDHFHKLKICPQHSDD